MKPELSIIVAFLKHDTWKQYAHLLQAKDFPEELQLLYRTLNSFHEAHEQDLLLLDLAALFFANKPSNKEFYEQLFNSVAEYSPNETAVVELVQSMRRSRLLRELSIGAYEAAEGKRVYQTLEPLLAGLQEDLVSSASPADIPEFITTDLEKLVTDAVKTPGLRWRLNTLNRMLGSLRKGDFGFVFARPECLHPDTPVMLYSGKVVSAKEVSVGMALMGDDSTPRWVEACTWGKQPMYKITYPWGESYTVNENHILSLKRSKEEGPYKYGDILNVSVKEYLTWPTSRKQRYKGWKTGISFSEHHVKIDPYFLGVWLGDGTSDNQQITNADKPVISWLQGYCAHLGLTYYQAERKSQGKAYTISFTNKKGYSNPLKELLKQYNLIQNKHIPEDYKYNSEWVRQQVLAGLIDTDGYYDKIHNGYEITTVSLQLANDIVFLSRSLGLHATLKERDTHYRIGIYGDLTQVPIQIPRKQQINKKTTKRKGLQFGFSIEPLGEGDYYGFTLSGNHLFLLGDFTVTHNTGKTTFLASEISHMLTQTDGDVLWFNNEEQGSKVMLRMYQAFFGVAIEELYANTQKFNSLFNEETQGRFKLIDAASIDWFKVEKICKQTKPSLILFDQIDKIKGFDADREDLHLGAIYQWAREIAKTYAPTIGVCQADGSGENQKWLTMANVANAKTAKQAEADWILGIGKIHDTGWENLRFFHLSKNKLIGDVDTDPALRHGKEVVLIEPQIARYADMEKS